VTCLVESRANEDVCIQDDRETGSLVDRWWALLRGMQLSRTILARTDAPELVPLAFQRPSCLTRAKLAVGLAVHIRAARAYRGRSRSLWHISHECFGRQDHAGHAGRVSSAVHVTFAGSMIPASTRSTCCSRRAPNLLDDDAALQSGHGYELAHWFFKRAPEDLGPHLLVTFER
jgi:hypothetical protein